MFDKILIKSGGYCNEQGGLDIRNLVDSMLYYNEVYILATQFELKQLLDTFGEDNLFDLINSRRLIVYLIDENYGVSKQNENIYSIGLYTRNLNDQEQLLCLFLDRLYDDKKHNKKVAARFSPFLPIHKYPFSIGDTIRDDILDSRYLSNVTQIVISRNYTEYGDTSGIIVNATQLEYGGFYKFEHNIDIDKIDKEIHGHGLSSAFDLSQVLLPIGLSDIDCIASTMFQSELLANQSLSDIYSLRINSSVQRATKSQSDINLFQSTFAFNYLSLGDAFVRGRITSTDLVKLLNHKDSIEFRSWTSNLSQDAVLNGECFEEMSDKLSDKPVVKTIRSFISGVLGFIPGIGSLVSFASSIADQFIAEKILNGWKPNVFLDNVIRVKNLKKE